MSPRPHDYPHLIDRWRLLARRHGMVLRKFANTGFHDLFYLRTPTLETKGGVYISAGIHGDEAGATEGMLDWAESLGKKLRDVPALLLPCLNPWGLLNNSRVNENGLDLNRQFQNQKLPMVRGVRALVKGYHFKLALQLHEDYDGQGIYIYEVARGSACWGEALLDAARSHVPIETRKRIEGRKVAGGLVRRRIDFRRFQRVGYPEAVWMHLEHSEHTFTVETPSEFALERRVAAQAAVITAAIRRALD